MKRIHLSLVILVSLLVPLTWFKTGKIIGGAEEGLSFSRPMQTAHFYQYSWYEIQGGSPQTIAKSRYPIYKVLGHLNNLGIPANLLQILLFAVLSMSAGVGMYLLSTHLDSNSKYFGLLASLYYIFNPFTYANIWHRFISYSFFVYALIPLSTTLFLVSVKYSRFLLIIPFLIVTTIFSYAFSSPSSLITFWLILLLALLYSVLLCAKTKTTLKTPIIYFFLYFLGWLIVSWWWLKPLLSNSQGIFNQVFSSQANLEVLRSIGSQYPFHVFIRLGYPNAIQGVADIATYIFLILTIIGIWVSFRSAKFILPAILLAIGLILVNGSNFPFGGIFEYFFSQLTFLQVYRNPYEKLGILLSISYSCFFSWGLIWGLRRKPILTTSLVAFLYISWVIPIWSQPFGSNKVNLYVKVPGDYTKVNQYLNLDTTEFRVLDMPVLPGDSVTGLWSSGNYRGLNPTEFLIDKPVFSRLPRQGLVDSYWKYLRKMSFTGKLAQFSKYGNIKYFLLHKDFDPKTSGIEDYLTTKANLKLGAMPSGAGAKLTCELNKSCELGTSKIDLSRVKFLNIKINSTQLGTIRLDIQDENHNHLVFNGELENEYRLAKADLNKDVNFVFDLRTPTEKYSNFSATSVSHITLSFFPEDNIQAKVLLSPLVLDQGISLEQVEIFEVFDTDSLTLYQLAPEYFRERIYVSNKINHLKNWQNLLYMQTYPEAFILSDYNAQVKSIDFNYIATTTPEVIITKNSSAKYTIDVNSGKEPYWLIFSDSYNNKWELSDSKGQFDHFVANGFSNGYFVDRFNSTKLQLTFDE